MDIKAEKLNLVREILEIEDINLIKEVKNLIQTRKRDWFDDLTEEQQQSVLSGLEQLDRGEFTSHEEACRKLGL